MEAQISSELSNERFDNFYPGHYGYQPPDVWIDTIHREDGCFTVKGSISTTVQLGSAREEDGMDVPYASAFTAVFSRDDDPAISLDEIELESLELALNDWIVHESVHVEDEDDDLTE